MSRKHRISGGRTYKSWLMMKSRCDVKTQTQYEWYGARGISYPEKWKKYEGFLQDMGERPEGMSLDRIDNNKSYSKENCRWATHQEQCKNRRSNIVVTVNGETNCLKHFTDKYGLCYSNIREKYRNGHTIESLFGNHIKEISKLVQSNVKECN